MAEEFTKSIKNISGITSHYGFKSTSASGVHFTLGAETVIIHSTCSELFVMIKDTCVKAHRGEFLLIDPFTPYSVIYNPEAEEQTYEQLSFRATTDQWNKTSCFVFAKGSKREVSREKALELKKLLDPKIKAVGVFVREDPEIIAELPNS